MFKENAGAECVYNQDVVPKIVKIMKVEKNQKIRYLVIIVNEPIATVDVILIDSPLIELYVGFTAV